MAPHDLVIKCVKYIIQKDKNIEIVFVTNCFNLTKDFAEDLLKINANYTFTLDLYGVNKKRFKEITQIDGFERCKENIKEFMNIKKLLNNKCKVLLQTLEYILTNKEKKDFIKFGREIGVDKVVLGRLHPYPYMPLNNLGVKNPPKGVSRYPCNQPFNSLNIYYNGDATVCCLNFGNIIVGNVKNNTLKEIWTGNKWNNIRNKLLTNELDELICKNCNVWYYETRLFFENRFEQLKNYIFGMKR